MDDTSNRADRSDFTDVPRGNLTIERQMLFMIVSVLLITVIEQVTVGFGLIHVLSLAALLVVACYWLLIIMGRVITLKASNSANYIGISAVFGSLLFALIAALLASSNNEYFGYTIVGIVTSVCSLILFISGANHESQTLSVDLLEQGNNIDVANRGSILKGIYVPSQPKPIPMPQIIHPTTPPYSSPARPLKEITARVDTGLRRQLDIKPLPNLDALLLLFEKDPLYTLAQTKSVRLFVQTRSNGPQVRCEDAFALSDDETCFALADGVSKSSFPRAWATLLAQQWVKEPFYIPNATSLRDWLHQISQNWETWIYHTWLPTINKYNIPRGLAAASETDAIDRIEEGAAATLLGICLDRKKHEWRMMAIGDTCVFIGKRNGVQMHLEGFPLKSSHDFDDTPPFISSRLDQVASLLPFFHSEQGSYSQGDFLLMATDSLAAWLYTQIEQDNPKWQEFLDMTEPKQFAMLIDEQRDRGILKDDDTSLVVIKL